MTRTPSPRLMCAKSYSEYIAQAMECDSTAVRVQELPPIDAVDVGPAAADIAGLSDSDIAGCSAFGDYEDFH